MRTAKFTPSLLTFTIATGLHAGTCSAVNDFSTASIPNGAWSSGTSPTLGGAFTPFPATGSGGCGGALQGCENFEAPPYVMRDDSYSHDSTLSATVAPNAPEPEPLWGVGAGLLTCAILLHRRKPRRARVEAKIRTPRWVRSY